MMRHGVLLAPAQLMHRTWCSECCLSRVECYADGPDQTGQAVWVTPHGASPSHGTPLHGRFALHKHLIRQAHPHFPLHNPAACPPAPTQLPPMHGMPQAGEEWRGTDLAPAVDFFTDTFLAGCARASKGVMASRARAAAAAPSLAF